ILKDSLKETIDSSVFFVVLIFSALAFLLVATVSFEPNPPAEGLDKLADRFSDRISFNVPGVGKVPFGEQLTKVTVKQVEHFQAAKHPWDRKYESTLEARDHAALGTRATVLFEIMSEEERKDRDNPTRNSRGRRFPQAVDEDVKAIQERPRKKGGGN